MTRATETTELSDPQKLVRDPVVSVYMLTYRHARFIAEAIDGVLAQRCAFPIELVIGEDCSPDDTRRIVLDYQRRYPETIRVLVSEANVGGKANAARCRAALRGEYVAVCEGDDYWCDPTKLARQMQVFDDHPDCSLVFHAARVVDAETGRSLRATRWPFRSRMFSLKDLVLGDGGLVPTASILVRRNVFLEREAWVDEAPVGDYPLALSAAISGRVAYLDRIMSVYRANVPHSWTQRHVPSIANRYRYASQIDTMLNDMLRTHAADPARRAVEGTISKYYSDVLVRAEGSADERAEVFAKVRDKLRGSDRFLGWLATRHNVRLPMLKTLIRQSKTSVRLLRAQFGPGV